jgi:ABC-2 type transport system ATP-binding protein
MAVVTPESAVIAATPDPQPATLAVPASAPMPDIAQIAAALNIAPRPFKPVTVSAADFTQPAVSVAGLSKQFLVEQEPPTTVAGYFVNLMQRKKRQKQVFWALKDISFDIYLGETLGIIGPNGSGKSTLLKLIAGIYQPTSGSVTVRRDLIPLLELGAGFHPELTGRENIYLNGALLGRSRAEMDALFEPIVAFSGIGNFINTPLKFYSSGMKVRLGFSVAVHIDTEVMLLDEIFAVGDDDFQRKCISRLRQFQAEGRALVLVSHGMEIIDKLCDRAIWIQHGRLEAEGSAAAITAKYKAFVRGGHG